MSETEYLSSTEAAKALDITPATLRAWERKGYIHATRPPGGWRRFTREEVERVKAGK